MFQAYFAMTFRLIRTETSPVKTIKLGQRPQLAHSLLLIKIVHKGYLISLEIRSVIFIMPV